MATPTEGCRYPLARLAGEGGARVSGRVRVGAPDALPGNPVLSAHPRPALPTRHPLPPSGRGLVSLALVMRGEEMVEQAHAITGGTLRHGRCVLLAPGHGRDIE